MPFTSIGLDSYDCSIELYGVPAEWRMSADVQKAIRDMGFGKAYFNHDDKWETHYTFNGDKPVDGWRVSYPHKRNDGDGRIWVERHIPTWPQEWFERGSVIIKAGKDPAEK